MSAVTPLRPVAEMSTDEWAMRVDLAAVFRLTAQMNWHEAVANHFSLAVSADGKQFLMNPKWRHFSRIRASDLLLIDAADPQTMRRPDAPDLTAWCIHGAMHASVPQARLRPASPSSLRHGAGRAEGPGDRADRAEHRPVLQSRGL